MSTKSGLSAMVKARSVADIEADVAGGCSVRSVRNATSAASDANGAHETENDRRRGQTDTGPRVADCADGVKRDDAKRLERSIDLRVRTDSKERVQLHAQIGTDEDR